MNNHCNISPVAPLGVILLGLFCFSLSLILPHPAQAHRVLLFAWVEGGMVHVEGGFGGGKAAKGCKVQAFDGNQTLVFTGKTDDKGLCAFDIPPGHTGEMRLVLEAGPGHKGAWTIGGDEFAAAAPTSAAQVAEHHEAMEEGPDPLKILVGLGVIFGLALGVGILKKRSRSHA